MTRGCGAFVGRQRELGDLEQLVEAARAGSGASVLVAGEAGIGKTRLSTEIASRACAAGFEVLLGRSIDLVGTELPYQPLVEALHPLGELRLVDAGIACSQLEVFEATLALLARRASLMPVLEKLGAPNRRETAAIAHRLAPPPGGQPQLDG